MEIEKKVDLYINFGNTTSSFAIFNFNNIEENIIIKKKTKQFTKEEADFNFNMSDVIEKLGIKNVGNVFVCSVIYKLNKRTKNYFKEKNTEVVFLSNENQSFLNLNKLYNRWELGADLISQSIYVTHFFKEAIVISLGTATAIYHIKNNIFNGCIIMPGIKTSQSYLEELIDVKFPVLNIQKKTLGLNTKEAISIGILNSIKITAENLMNELKINCPIIYTGGNSSYFNDLQWWNIENLEILGLFIFSKNYYQSNKKKNTNQK